MSDTNNHMLLGQTGESLAVDYLQRNNYEILTTNWRYSRAEIDIIAKRSEQLIFVEVKTRSSLRNGYPEDDVDEHKKRMLFDAASAFMEQENHMGEIRFDIISIIISSDQRPNLRHIPDAFFPGLF